jgi:hypothetical protein
MFINVSLITQKKTQFLNYTINNYIRNFDIYIWNKIRRYIFFFEKVTEIYSLRLVRYKIMYVFLKAHSAQLMIEFI